MSSRLVCLTFAFKLVATPYLSGIIAVVRVFIPVWEFVTTSCTQVELFPLPTRRLSNNVALPANFVVQCFFLVITVINLVWNGLSAFPPDLCVRIDRRSRQSFF
jgi:hypothetical protein